jgi:hypothetical protein
MEEDKETTDGEGKKRLCGEGAFCPLYAYKEKKNVQMSTYRLGPRSDENSQWKIKMLRFLGSDISFCCSGCLMSTNSFSI